MAQSSDIESVDGVCRVWDRHGDRNFFCESTDQALAIGWINQAKTLEGIETLAVGMTLGSISSRQLNFKREIPFGYDYHWVREVAAGVVRGTTGLRLDANASATVAVGLTAAVETRIRLDNGRLRLELSSAAGKSGSAALKAIAGIKSEVKAAGGSDALLSALAGIHPLEWVRKMLAASGSSQWRALADAAGIRTRQLDELYTIWQEFSARSEAAVWRALGDDSEFAQLRRVAVQVAEGRMPVATAGSAAEQWLATLASDTSATVARSLLTWLDDSLIVTTAETLRQYAFDVLNPEKLTDWAVSSISQQFGRALTMPEAKETVGRVSALCESIYAKTASALNRSLAAELTAAVESSSGERTILDVSFPATPAGAAQLRSVYAGGLDAALDAGPDVVIHKGLLEAFLARRRYIGLNLPFTGHKHYRRDLDAFASAAVETDAFGRIIVYKLTARQQIVVSGIFSSSLLLASALSARDGDPKCDNLDLTFEHKLATRPGLGDAAWNRVFGAYGFGQIELPESNGEAALTVTAPGDLVLSWTSTPHHSTPEFADAMSRISVAVQLLMRRWLPAIYFADPKRYQDIGAAWPLLVYAASRPYRTTGRRDYAYDAMNRDSIAAAASSAALELPHLLAGAHSKLSAAGLTGRLRFFESNRPGEIISDALRRPQFASLLSADAFLVQDMVRLAETGRELRSIWSRDPRTVVRRLSSEGTFFVRAFHSRLKRLYGGNELLGLSSLVLVEATAALAGSSARCRAQLEWTGEDGGRMFWTPE